MPRISGTSGTITNSQTGVTSNYTVTSNNGTVRPFNGDPVMGGDAYLLGLDRGGNPQQTYTFTFDQPISGVSFYVDYNDGGEDLGININGTFVNLQTAIAQGRVTLSGSSTNRVLQSDGYIDTVTDNNHPGYTITFNDEEITSIGIIQRAESPGTANGIGVGINATPVCFTSGTLIDTPTGKTDVDDLKVGDEVVTFSGINSTIRWISKQKYDLTAPGNLTEKRRPVRIMAGALGGGLPQRDLLVSRQHRMLISSDAAERLTGERDVLIAAAKLVQLPGIYVDDSVESVEYVHFVCDEHEIIFAEGAASETLYPGPQAFASLTEEARDELRAILPAYETASEALSVARHIPHGRVQQDIIREMSTV